MSFTSLSVINNNKKYAPFDEDLKEKFIFRINCERNPIHQNTKNSLLHKKSIFDYFNEEYDFMDIINTNKFYKIMMGIKSNNENMIYLQNFIKKNTIKEGDFYNIYSTHDIYLYLNYILNQNDDIWKNFI